MFRPVPNGTGSRSRASRRNCTQGHRLGGGSVRESGQTHQNRSHTTAYVSHVPRRYAHLRFFSEDDDDDLGNYSGHGYNDPMHALASAMANLDTIYGGGRRDHQSSRGDSRGLWSPFASIPGGDECLDRIMDIGELHIGAFQEVFSSLFFTGRRVDNQPGDVLADFFPVGRVPDDSFHNRGVGRGDHLPFHVHAASQRRDMNNQATPRREDVHNQAVGPYVYLPVEFEPTPLEEAIEPTETGEQRINRFIAHHTEPLSAANTTSTTNTNCPICMENATAHACVKIRGIAGCEHMIGKDCLKELLLRRPGHEKTCPLCRAVFLRVNGVWQNSQGWGRRTGRANRSISSVPRNIVASGRERLAGLLGGDHGQQGYQGREAFGMDRRHRD